MPKPQVTIPLDIPDVCVLGKEITPKGEVSITVKSIKEETICHRCGKIIQKFHGMMAGSAYVICQCSEDQPCFGIAQNGSNAPEKRITDK